MTDIDRNFNNTIDEYYSSEIGSEFEDDLTESEIDELLDTATNNSEVKNEYRNFKKTKRNFRH